jgi:hypothetical protein
MTSNIIDFLHKEYFSKYSDGIKIHPQLYQYIIRFFDFLEEIGLSSEEFIFLRMDLIFINKNISQSEKFLQAKLILKNYQSNIKLFLNFYKWSISNDRFDDADKILNLLLSKGIDTFKTVLMYERISHYILFILLNKKSFFELQELIFSNIESLASMYFNVSYKDLDNLSRLLIIKKLEKNLTDSQFISSIDHYSFLSITFTLVLYYVFIEDHRESLHKVILAQFSNYSKKALLYNNSQKRFCKHFIKEQLSLIFLKILNFTDKLFPLKITPKFLKEIMVKVNNYTDNAYDIAILFSYCNNWSKGIYFIKHFSKIITLKHSYYLLQFQKNENNQNFLNTYKLNWNKYEENLLKIRQVSEEFSSLEEAKNETKMFKIVTSASNALIMQYWTSLIKLLLHHKMNQKVLEYSLFALHFFPFSKPHYLKYIKYCSYIEDKSEEVHVSKFLSDLVTLKEMKEIRFLSEINFI